MTQVNNLNQSNTDWDQQDPNHPHSAVNGVDENIVNEEEQTDIVNPGDSEDYDKDTDEGKEKGFDEGNRDDSGTDDEEDTDDDEDDEDDDFDDTDDVLPGEDDDSEKTIRETPKM